MAIDESVLRKVGASYRIGGFDAEACEILVTYVAGFEPCEFDNWLVREPELRQRVESGRILARGAWDKAIREGARVLPDWYYSPPSEAVRELITLACRAAETCPIGSSEREREFKNVERLLAVCKKDS